MAAPTQIFVSGPQGALNAVRDYLRNGEIALAFGILAILVVLLLPLPAWLLDVCLSFSITFAILILMTSIFIRKPLEFSSFPTGAADFHHAARGAQSRVDAAYPVARQ
jgi:flagellar biosynthesis protein FlhA